MDVEQEELQTPAATIDPINLAVGAGYYVKNHRFANLYIETEMGRSPRLAVERYYWDLEHPVAVDFIRSLCYGELEFATKKAYCKEHNIRYILVRNEWDGEGAETALLKYENPDEAVEAIQDAARPLVGPRRRR